MGTGLKVSCLILGYFEFLAVNLFFFSAEIDLLRKHPLLPSIIITDLRVKILYCAYILTLGLQRLTFAYGNQSVGSWLCLVTTHAIECGLWWSLALSEEFNKNNLSVTELFVEAAQLKLPGGINTAIMLLIVPTLTMYFLINGIATHLKRRSTGNNP